jgi:hypothetical protein
VKPINSESAAQRLARAIASDILLYNEDEVLLGIANDDFFTRLAPQIEEGRKLYEGRVSENIRQSYNFFDCAIVDVIIREKGAAIDASIW